jgi:hypothetical protein
VTPASWLLLGSLGSTDVAQLVGGPSRLRLVLAYVRRSRAHDPTDVHRINHQRMVVNTRRTRHVPAVEWSHVDQVQGMSGPIEGIAQIEGDWVSVGAAPPSHDQLAPRAIGVSRSIMAQHPAEAHAGVEAGRVRRNWAPVRLTRLDPSVSRSRCPGSDAWFRRRVPAPQRALARDVSRAPLARRGECRSPPGGRLPQPGPR